MPLDHPAFSPWTDPASQRAILENLGALICASIELAKAGDDRQALINRAREIFAVGNPEGAERRAAAAILLQAGKPEEHGPALEALERLPRAVEARP